MIHINNANISMNGKELYIDMETVVEENRIISLFLWTHNTFKNYSEALDITEYLNQTTNKENITIKAIDLGLESFEGLIFIEAEDNDEEMSEECSTCSNVQLMILTNFNKFYKCIADELNKINLNNCVSLTDGSCCNPSIIDKVILMNLTIEGVKMNLSVGRYNVAVELMKKLNKLCRNCMSITTNTAHCTTCND